MNDDTPRDDGDDLVRLYHAAADLEGGAPAPAVAAAARAHARVMARAWRPSQAPTAPVVGTGAAPVADAAHAAHAANAANAPRWRVSVLGSLAVIGLAGLLLLQFDRGTPQEQDLVRAPGIAALPRGDAAATAPAPTADPAAASAPAAVPAAAAPAGADAMSAQDAASARERFSQPAGPRPALTARPSAGPDNAAAAGAAAPRAPSLDDDVPLAPPDLRARADTQAAKAAPATALPPGAGGTGSALSAPPANPRAASEPGPGVAAADAHGLAAAGDWPALALRLAAGTPVDIRDARGRTPLMRAAGSGHIGLVRQLLDAGADPRLVDADGRSAGDWARRADRPDIAALLDAAQVPRDSAR